MTGTPQAITSPATEAAIFLVATIAPGAEAAVRRTLGDVDTLRRSVGFRIPEAQLTCVTSIASGAWDRLYPDVERPAELHPFRALSGPRHTAPATPGDVLFHIRARRTDLCFEAAQRIRRAFGDTLSIVDEVHGFRSFDDRDLLGFVDGTENPEGAAVESAALVGDEDPAFTGGSYVIVQKYVHDLESWDALSTEAQEQAVGRTKLDDIEFPDEDKAPDAHIVLNQVTGADGEERQILRFNMPFGSVGDGVYGTYYIAYSASPAVTEEMLENMFLGRPAGVTDRLLDFSTALTGGLFFTPTLEFLEDGTLDDEDSAMAATADPEPPARPDTPDDGSLGIGSLKGSDR